MTNPITLDLLHQELRSRFDAIDAQVSDQRLLSMIQTELKSLLSDEEFVRKMRFAGGDDGGGKLYGTRYARHGLSIADIEFLYDLQVSLKGQRKTSGGYFEGPSDELTNTFNAITEACYVSDAEIREIDKRAIDGLFPRIPLASFSKRDQKHARKGNYHLTEAYERAIRAMDTAESGYGSQLVGAQYVGELWGAARQDSKVFGLIGAFEMTDPTAYLPVEVDFPELLFVAESTANNSSNYTSVKTGSNRVQVDAKKFVIHQMWSGEMDEDSIIPFIPFLRVQVAKSLGYYSDSLVLNADTTNAGTGNINLDDADPADTKHYLAFDGIRHAGLVDNTGNSKDLAGPISLAALQAARGRMVDTTNKIDWGHPNSKDDLVYIADLETADKIALLDELATKDKAGNEAGAFNGEVARVLGHPVVASIALSKTEADGKVSTTGSNNIKGQVVTFNRNAFKVGWRRRIKAEVERLPATDQTRMVYSLRMGFGRFTATGNVSGIEGADVIYNIDLT